MGTLQEAGNKHQLTPNPEATTESKEEHRRRRVSALKAAEGLWKNRTDVPKDGIEYQEQLRAEWL